MRRPVTTFVLAASFFCLGWLVSRAVGGPPGVFRITIDAPAGETQLKCDGCQFLTWTPEGRAGERQPAVSFSCNKAPCAAAFGAVAVAQGPKLIAELKASSAP